MRYGIAGDMIQRFLSLIALFLPQKEGFPSLNLAQILLRRSAWQVYVQQMNHQNVTRDMGLKNCEKIRSTSPLL